MVIWRRLPPNHAVATMLGMHEPTAFEPTNFAALPLFPLGTVLFPDGLLPLQIFEVRYLDMIGKCHKNGTPFGVVALTSGSEVRQRQRTTDANGGITPAGDGFVNETFCDVATLATITALARPQPGLLQIQCVGTQRIRIQRAEQLKHGLWVADAQTLPTDASVALPPDLQPVANALGNVIRSWQAQGASAEQIPFAAPYRLDDCGWVANRWCELLQIPLDVKQRLMALDNPLVRLELVRDILESYGNIL